MRHNLLIVDDEELIRQGLIARIEYLGIDVDEIFEAENGTEALEMVDLHPIDIIITDIKMPDMNGIDMIQEIQKRKNGIQFVVLSGYAEFSYAETAIRLGVKAYLLKPLSNDELKNTFQRLYEEMENNAKMRYIERQQKKLDKEKQEYLLEKEINAIFAGATDEVLSTDILEHAMNRRKTDTLHNKCVYLAIVHVDKESYKDNGFHKVDHELIRFSVKNVFYEVDSLCEKIIVNSLSDYNKLYGIFIMDDEKRLRNEIEKIFLKMRSVLEKKMEIFLTFGVSRCAQDIRNYSVKEAQSALKQRIIYGNSNLYFYEDIRIMEKQHFSTSQMHLLEQYMEKEELHKVKDLLYDIFSEKKIREYGTPYIRIMWVRILNIILHLYGRKSGQWSGIEKALMNFNLPDQMQSIPEIRQKVIEIVMNCFKMENMAEIDGRTRIQMAVQYIKEHYSENLTVNDLAEVFDMSPNYFSSIFKKEMNQSPVNFITGIRMRKAQEMLLSSNLSVADIAQKTGYEDGQYFFRVFKKHTGMTPLQYRENTGAI